MYSSLNGIKRSIILSTHHFTNTFVFFQKKIKSLPAVMDISFQFNIAYSQPLWILVYIYKQVDPYQHSLSLGQSESSLDERYLYVFVKISIKNDTKVHIKFRTLAKIIYHERAMIYLCVDTKLDNYNSLRYGKEEWVPILAPIKHANVFIERDNQTAFCKNYWLNKILIIISIL